MVPEEEQITHQIGLDDELQIQEGLSKCSSRRCKSLHGWFLDVYKYDPDYLANEEKYGEIKTEILGDGSDDSEGESGSEDSEDDGMLAMLNLKPCFMIRKQDSVRSRW